VSIITLRLSAVLEDKFSNDWKVEYQKSNEYLSSNPKAFNMQHDIFLTSKTADRRKVIIDTKYKLRSLDFKNDIKKGIAQADLYQMTSYAFRRGCTDIFLLYPNITDIINEPDIFEINSGFNIDDNITITAMEIPFWTKENLDITKLENKLYNTLKKQLDKLKT
jgi:5-methylcytosine-specific restriction enzyme subunit McrC